MTWYANADVTNEKNDTEKVRIVVRREYRVKGMIGEEGSSFELLIWAQEIASSGEQSFITCQ